MVSGCVHEKARDASAYLKIVIGRIGWEHRGRDDHRWRWSSKVLDLGIDVLLVVLALLDYAQAPPAGGTPYGLGFLPLRYGSRDPARRDTYLRRKQGRKQKRVSAHAIREANAAVA